MRREMMGADVQFSVFDEVDFLAQIPPIQIKYDDPEKTLEEWLAGRMALCWTPTSRAKHYEFVDNRVGLNITDNPIRYTLLMFFWVEEVKEWVPTAKSGQMARYMERFIRQKLNKLLKTAPLTRLRVQDDATLRNILVEARGQEEYYDLVERWTERSAAKTY